MGEEQPKESGRKEEIIKRFSCPKCGSTDRLMERIAAPERQSGALPDDVVVFIETKSGTVLNPRIQYVPGTLRPAGTTYWDLCFECGQYYCFLAKESQSMLAASPGVMFGKGQPGR